MRTIIYVDGFNFYGLLARSKYSKYRWLDLKKFFEILLPENDIIKVKYFTAKMDYNPKRKNRQQIYFNTLKHLYPDFFVFIYGEFKKIGSKHFEKQTDVNLASHMVNDSWLNEYDCAVIVTNDTDFVQAMELVKETMDFKKEIICIPPVIKSNEIAKSLKQFTGFKRKNKNIDIKITEHILYECQLPKFIESTPYSKPIEWN